MNSSKPNLLPLSALTTALLAACCASPAFAQAVAPDAGQVLRDLQQTPALPRPAPSLQRIEEAVAPAGGDQARALVKAVTISGNQEIPTAELLPLVSGLVGAEQTLTQLNAAAARITAYYRSRGFAVARAYLPAQDITAGTVNFGVVEGRIASHKLDNRALLSNARADAYFGGIQDGDVIRSAQIDRGLLLLQDTPGVANSRATLQPGASVGTSELLIETMPSQRYGGNVVADNYGGRYTGEYRLSGSFNIASPLDIGDQLSFSALTSGSNLNYGRLAYALPLGSDGLRVGAAYFETRYKLGKEFAQLEAHGSATSTSLFATYPFVRSQLRNLSGSATVEQKNLKDHVDATSTFTPKKVNLVSLGLNGSLQDDLLGGGISSAELTLAQGRLSIDSPTARLIDSISARTAGDYTRVSYNLLRLQRFGDSANLLSLSFGGQQAGKNLDSSEKFSLGGPNGVRAYPQGEASGDEGYRGSLELRRWLGDNLQATVFYDWGQVNFNKEPFGAPSSNKRSLAGAGIGLNMSFAKIQVRSSLAWRTTGGVPKSIPSTSDKGPTLWVQATASF